MALLSRPIGRMSGFLFLEIMPPSLFAMAVFNRAGAVNSADSNRMPCHRISLLGTGP